jgi:hypothetical protein
MNRQAGNPVDGTIQAQLRKTLLELAHCEDELALAEAAAVPYRAPQPASVTGHRSAACCLRAEADRFLRAS